MQKLLRLAGRRMTTVIAALVISSIILSVGAVSAAIFFTLRSQALEAGHVQQITNLRVAATILEASFTNARLIWSESGEMEGFKLFAFPNSSAMEAVDAISPVTGQNASILQLDAETGAFATRATTLLNADGGAIDYSTVSIEPGSPASDVLLAGATYVGEIDIMGTRYFGALLPMSNLKGEVLGAIQVMTPAAHIEAGANAALLPIALTGGTAILVLGAIGFLVSRRISRPIPRLADVMRSIAGGAYDTEVPYAEDTNEIGDMARSVEVLRESAIRVSQLTEAEAARVLADEEKRAAMMAELQAAFGAVVDAALDGDFSRRVDAQFSDKELNALATSINELVDGFGRGMDELVRVLSAMAHADLTSRMSGSYRGAFAELKGSVNSLADKFSDVIGELKSASATLKQATGEILSGANDLSTRTTRQAATIEEASASMEQLAGMVVQNAKRANEASQNASTVTEAATKSGETMHAADEAMERIRASSDKISNIIGLIDDIAFQTNLLALNASVEAARAGDAGKGFAVVAVEVRRLAQSAAQASSEVKTLIEQAATEVGAGSRLVDEASKGLETMRTAAQSNETLLDAIARDSREQATSIEDINAAVRQLDEMTQHNAALVEETNASIEQTGEQASALDKIVSVFSVAEQTAPEAKGRRAA